MSPHIQIEESWKKVLAQSFQSEYFESIRSFLKKEQRQKKIYPPGKLIFNAFNCTPFHAVKLIIIGQDPYHNPGQAMGLSFSVPGNFKIPPSLRNIYKELEQDIGIEKPNHGDLTAWAKQGVFLLNSILTVEERNAGSHRKIGWQAFTDDVIKILSDQKEGLVFLLWGNFAKSKADLINEEKHLVLKSAHPSPLAGGAFFGNNHFSLANAYLIQNGEKPINWAV